MKRAKLILNDVHIGVNRVAGATPGTAAALRARVFGELANRMMAHLDKDVVINGDLFDAYDILAGDALAFYNLACAWLSQGAGNLTLGRGNHDISKDSSRLSMFDFIAQLLVARFPGRADVVVEAAFIDDHVYIIPHCTNQEIFNIELAKALDLPCPCYILLHANFDNGYTVGSDHSLNVSPEQAQALVAKGHVLIFGHEHQAREPVPGVVVEGNQYPTSVADCLNNPGDYKRCIVIPAEGKVSVDALVEIETWHAAGSFAEVDWRDVAGCEIADNYVYQFIRVIGTAAAEEAAAVIQAVSKLRQKSPAFVVTNGVKIEGIQDMEEIAIAAEEMKAVDVMGYLLEQLEPAQAEVISRLVAEHMEAQ